MKRPLKQETYNQFCTCTHFKMHIDRASERASERERKINKAHETVLNPRLIWFVLLCMILKTALLRARVSFPRCGIFFLLLRLNFTKIFTAGTQKLNAKHRKWKYRRRKEMETRSKLQQLQQKQQQQRIKTKNRVYLVEVWWMRMKASDYRILRMKYVWFFVLFCFCVCFFPYRYFLSLSMRLLFIRLVFWVCALCAFHCALSEFQ